MTMYDPHTNKVKLNDWSEAFWLKTRFLWVPFVVLYKIISKDPR
jgi:hypothetical protein